MSLKPDTRPLLAYIAVLFVFLAAVHYAVMGAIRDATPQPVPSAAWDAEQLIGVWAGQ